jgi:sugar phosphate isomerase/epimerase
MAGMGIVVDFYSAWYERGLEELVRKHIDSVALVQLCDYKLGTFDMPNRCAVGDGDIPVERLLGLVLDAGYEGPFDLEILGPRIEEEGYGAPIARSLERAGEMLARLGA